MKLKNILLASCAICSIVAWAEPVAVHGDFAAVDKEGFPVGWHYHGWSGYLPQAKVDVAKAGAKSVLRFRDVNGKDGAGVLTRERLPCSRGDIVRVSWSMRGKGKGFARFQSFNREGVTNGGYTHPSAEGTADWKRYEFVRSIDDGTFGANVSFVVGIGCEKGSEIEFADVTCEIQRRFFDNFENDLARAGNPEIVTGIVAPGLLERTRQGVYRTNASLTVPMGDNVCTLPELNEVNPFLESGFRLYALGGKKGGARLTQKLLAGKVGLTLRLEEVKSKNELRCELADDRGKKLGSLPVPVAMLPADFLVRASKSGEWNLSVRSLADSSVRATKGRAEWIAGNASPFASSLELKKTGGATAEMTVDNLMFGRAVLELECPPAPCKIEALPTFDPVKAGWPLVFSDEFDGDRIDSAKWASESGDSDWKGRAFVKDGLLHILADWDEKHEKLTTASLRSIPRHTYGYFEARLRFTQKNGWWAAFWLSAENANPFVRGSGFEIDIFEDYYTRDRDPLAPRKGILDHNLHIFNGEHLKSWNFNSKLPGSLDDFYVLGCKWTPFEISYYLNGKLISSKSNHGGFDSVTFDAIRHAAGIAPLCTIVSGQIMEKGWDAFDKTGVNFPDTYLVDYVRVYGYPDEPGQSPQVRLQADTNRVMVAEGSKMKIGVKATPAKATGAPIRTVYLFDDGYLVDYRTEEPFTFDVEFTKDYFGKTRFAKPGRSGRPREFDSYPHVFCVFVQDANGRVGHSETVTKIVARTDASRPFKGVAQKIPGKILAGCYDEGGQGVAYFDTMFPKANGGSWRPDECPAGGKGCVGSVGVGEWLVYSVDVERAGDYSAQFRYGTPDKSESALMLLVDGAFAGRFACHGHDAKFGWGSDTVATLPHVPLTAGRHRIAIVCEGRYNFTDLTFTPNLSTFNGGQGTDRPALP